jgi:serine/threonine protein kinase
MTGGGEDAPAHGAVAAPLGLDDPQEIGPFRIIGLLGTGGMGEVYLGTVGEGYVAVKRVRPQLVTVERFKREVALLHQVPPGVAPGVWASDSTASRPWFATEYVPGVTADEAVRLHGPLPADALWLLLAETAGRLRVVHRATIVHRDLKPANVMLVRDGVKLIDFGIARAADQVRLTRGSSGYGTRGFTAPEQEAGEPEVDAPADVYSLGALLLYASSGRTPGAVPDLEPLRAHDPRLADVVEACLAHDPAVRPTAADLVDWAREHTPVPDPSWPAAIMERISAREHFAATPVGKMDTIPPPAPSVPSAPPVPPESERGAEPGAEPGGGSRDGKRGRHSRNGDGNRDGTGGKANGDGDREERGGGRRGGNRDQSGGKSSNGNEGNGAGGRGKSEWNRTGPGRRRALLVALPVALVLVIGGITAFEFLPAGPAAQPDARSSSTASAGSSTARVTPSASAQPSRSASPTADPATSAPPTQTDDSSSHAAPETSGPSSPAVRGPAGPSADHNYISGSEVTVPGCAGWVDFSGDLYVTVSAGNASCSADDIRSDSSIGGDATNAILAAQYTEANSSGPYAYFGSYHFSEQVCVWNQAVPSARACSGKYTDNSGTESTG